PLCQSATCNHPSQAHQYMNLAIIRAMQGNLDESLSLFQKDLSIRTIAYGENHPLISQSYQNIGLLHTMRNEAAEATKAYRSSLRISEAYFGKNHPIHARTQANIALQLQQQQLWDEAIKNHRAALISLNAHDGQHFLPPEHISDAPVALKILTEGGRILEAKAQQSQGQADWQQALETYQYAAKLTDYMRRGYTSDGSRLNAQKDAFPIYEGGLRVCQQLGLSRDAFSFAEKANALILLEQYRQEAALQQAGLPEADIQLLKQLRQALRKQKGLANTEADSMKRQSLLRQATVLKRRNDSLMKAIEMYYPGLLTPKHARQLVSAQEVQGQILEEDQAMLQFVPGDSAVYAIVISADSIRLFDLGHMPKLTSHITQLRQALYGYFILAERTDSLFQAGLAQYGQHAYHLYQQLISPLESSLPPKLIIIPQGILGYLPFEALLYNKPSGTDSLRSWAFFLKKHQIQYAFSASMLKEMRTSGQNHASSGLLAVAPEFSPFRQNLPTQHPDDIIRGRLSPLPYSKKEVSKILDIWEGRGLLGEAATKAAFLTAASQYAILHIATHGQAGQKATNSFLAFSGAEDSIPDSFLYFDELYGLKLSSEMVVLSACETGIGELYRGEGMASLARGFSFAGAKSIVTSLWSVNDAQTAGFMGRFYEGLQEGLSKDAALRRAKLDVLATGDDYAIHPFFWSPFVITGDTRPIQHEPFPWWWAGLMVLGVLAVMLFYKLGFPGKRP
ncbi:MAG: CHAT domain-containing tetratricopeptide repeat protein, partial [Bacteroidota bacterium]